jgi:hypothetical protein
LSLGWMMTYLDLIITSTCYQISLNLPLSSWSCSPALYDTLLLHH